MFKSNSVRNESYAIVAPDNGTVTTPAKTGPRPRRFASVISNFPRANNLTRYFAVRCRVRRVQGDWHGRTSWPFTRRDSFTSSLTKCLGQPTDPPSPATNAESTGLKSVQSCDLYSDTVNHSISFTWNPNKPLLNRYLFFFLLPTDPIDENLYLLSI